MADDNELIIKLKIDRSLADAEAAAFHKAEKARIVRSYTDAEVAEKGRTAFINRENNQRVQEAAKATKTQIEIDAEAARRKAQLAKDAADAKKKADKEAADDAKQWTKRELTDAEVAERAKAEIIRRSNRQRAHEVADAHGREKGFVVDLKGLWDAKVASITKAGPAVAGVAVGMAALKVGVDVLQALDERTRRFTESTRDATKALIAQHKAHLELSGFAGTPGETGPELEKSAKLAAASGLTIEEAAGVRKASEAGAYTLVDREAVPAQNGMPAVDAQQGLISREEYDKAQVAAAKMAAYSGGNPEEYGRSTATILRMEGKRMTAAEVENRMLQYDKLATIGNFDTASGLFGHVDRNSALSASGVVAGDTLAGLTALFAQTNQETAATLTKQAVTAASASLLMGRGIKIDDAFKADATTTSGYAQSLGITRDMGVEDRLLTFARDIRREQAAVEGRGGNFNADEYLMLKGFGNEESRTALMNFAGKMDQWTGDIKPILGKQFPAGTIDATHANYLQNTESGQARAMEVGGDVSKAIVGTKFFGLNTAMEAEYNRQVADGNRMNPLADYMAPTPSNPFTAAWRSILGAPQSQLMGPVGASLDRELGRLGISIPAIPTGGMLANWAYSSPGSMLTADEVSPEDKARVFGEAQAAIKGAGGDPSLGYAKSAEKMVDALVELNRTTKQVEANTRARQQIPSGRPKAPPPRP